MQLVAVSSRRSKTLWWKVIDSKPFHTSEPRTSACKAPFSLDSKLIPTPQARTSVSCLRKGAVATNCHQTWAVACDFGGLAVSGMSILQSYNSIPCSSARVLDGAVAHCGGIFFFHQPASYWYPSPVF